MGAIDEGLSQIDFAAITQVLRQCFKDLPEHTVLDPLLHTAVTRLVGRVLTRQRFPRSSGPKDPKHSVENVASSDTRPPLAVLANVGFRDQRLDNTPLLVSELHVLLDHIRDLEAIVSDHVLKTDLTTGTCQCRFRDAF